MTNEFDKGLVYVVEDSQSSAALYCSYLQQAGYRTEHFLDGHSALVGIKGNMPDVIVQDVCLPDISGLDVLQFVNRQPSPARVVIITANSSIDVAVDAMRLGGFDFIEKPFAKERLLTAVENACDQLADEVGGAAVGRVGPVGAAHPRVFTRGSPAWPRRRASGRVEPRCPVCSRVCLARAHLRSRTIGPGRSSPGSTP